MENQTSVQTVDLDIDSWLGAPGADSIVTPTSTAKTESKPNLFSNIKTDMSFLDNDDKTDEDKEDDDEQDNIEELHSDNDLEETPIAPISKIDTSELKTISINLEESIEKIDYKKLQLPKLKSIVVEKGLTTASDASKLKKAELLKLLGIE